MFSGFRSAASRRTLIAFGVAASLCAASTLKAHPAQDPAAPAAAAPAQDKPDPAKFTTDRAIILYQVKPDKTADFEAAWAAIKAKLSASDKPGHKDVATSLNVYKIGAAAGAAAPAAGSPVIYLVDVTPTVKTQSYDFVQLIFYSTAFPDRPEADAVYKKITESVATPSVTIWPITKIGG